MSTPLGDMIGYANCITTVREILQSFAEEDPNETTLALRNGNDREKYTDLNFLITLVNGMKFIVLHEGPTTVS